MSRLVEEAFPEFEPKATEYMKLTRFLAGLDQGLQMKCHERGVKTFEEAFQVATQAERARQAAKLVPPTPCPSISSVTTAAQSVNTIDNDASLRKIVLHLTDTVRDLSHNFSTVKLALNNNSRRSRHDAYSPGRSQRSPSPCGRTSESYTSARRPARGYSPTGRPGFHHPSPEPYPKYPSHRGMDNPRQGYYTHHLRDREFSPHRMVRSRDFYPEGFSPDHYHDYRDDNRRQSRYPMLDGENNAFHCRSPSPLRKRVSFQDHNNRSQGHQRQAYSYYRDQGDHQQGNFN